MSRMERLVEISDNLSSTSTVGSWGAKYAKSLPSHVKSESEANAKPLRLRQVWRCIDCAYAQPNLTSLSHIHLVKPFTSPGSNQSLENQGARP